MCGCARFMCRLEANKTKYQQQQQQTLSFSVSAALQIQWNFVMLNYCCWWCYWYCYCVSLSCQYFDRVCGCCCCCCCCSESRIYRCRYCCTMTPLSSAHRKIVLLLFITNLNHCIISRAHIIGIDVSALIGMLMNDLLLLLLESIPPPLIESNKLMDLDLFRWMK